MTRHIIVSSDYGSLHFERDEDYKAYKAEERALHVKWHQFLCAKYGIYASNQGRYVQSENDLNDWDTYSDPLDRGEST